MSHSVTINNALPGWLGGQRVGLMSCVFVNLIPG